VFEDLDDPVDPCSGLWQSILEGNQPSSPSRFVVFTDLSTCAREFRRSSIHRWTSAVRTARPYFVALVRSKTDRRYTDLVDDILQASESRVSVCSWSPGDEDALRTYVLRAAFSTDPSAIIDVRYSVDEDRLWVCFGDGHNAALPWKNLGLGGVSPALLPKTAAISKDHDSIQVLRQDGSIFDIDSVAIRTLVDKAARQSIQETSVQSAQELGHLLRESRTAQGKTQLEVARISGLEQALISKLENGRHRPRFDTLRRYSEALGLTVGEILRPLRNDTASA
jgi:DNA-binding XRE family transcriptional regulator